MTEPRELGLERFEEERLRAKAAAAAAAAAAQEDGEKPEQELRPVEPRTPAPVEDEEHEEEHEEELRAEEAAEPADEAQARPQPQPAAPEEHAAGELDVPDDVVLLQGEPRGGRRAVGVVVSRFNGEITNLMLQRALDELEDAGVAPANVTVMPVPGAFELPLAAMALAKTRQFACVIALGCVIRGETPHFEYVAGEAASGLQLAALETGVPVSFGVLTVEDAEQAEARVERAADAVRSGLEMADVFAQLRRAATG